MIQIHLYENGGVLKEKSFPEFPCNSYKTDNADILLETIRDLLNNSRSGVGKILIENDEFGWDCSITNAQCIIDLDK